MLEKLKNIWEKLKLRWSDSSQIRAQAFEKLVVRLKHLRKRLPKKLENIRFKRPSAQEVLKHSNLIKWGILVVALFALSSITSRILSLWIRPQTVKVAKLEIKAPSPRRPVEDYGEIEKRNIFDADGTIPPPLDQGLLDCMAQAKRSTGKLQLLGTIVMSDERYSVALIQEEGNRLAIKKDESFLDGRYVALKVERKKFCFQAMDTQELEYVEIPEDDVGPLLSRAGGSGGNIVALSENQFQIKKSFLDEKLGNLHPILQSAKAVAYNDKGTGKMVGFLIQSMDADSPFRDLGVLPGDVLTSVGDGSNNIMLDNMGKGLEAFQVLRRSQAVVLEVIRNGQKKTLNYEVK